MNYEQCDKVSRVVVLGGTGFVGEALARQLANTALPPSRFIVHRSQPEWLDVVGVEVKKVDLSDSAEVLAALRGHDILINLLRPDGTGWYPTLMRSLQPTFRETGISRCLHASSIDVYAGVLERQIDEGTLPCPLSAYEQEHLIAEEILTGSFSETIVLRLGAIFGSGGRNLVSLAEEMKQAPSWKIALRRVLYGERRMHLVSVETVAQALVKLAFDRKIHGSQIVLVTDDSDPNNNFAFVQDRFAQAFGREFPKFGPTSPRFFLRFLLRLRGLPAQAIDRRFSAIRATELGLVSEAFTSRLDNYASDLARVTRKSGA
ncbi:MULTISPECIES: NAD-dependent epimerase/dehydratase family protein [unclassified Mesorhizobium]|uniref:NAD-dependent epimerase/dehydratase family protein n=1 Tax=unclassified Mesorhizobium TaxID=325217 RepID=UPI000FC9A021|nr:MULTISPECIES: NAD-dependent epimerase/dehydratase family protein [unclassified Mesorhizobium]RUY28899.1 NAD-dependent epimerase/dehydratase family protein [Mesorhizobium sp. M7A.F.Ca.US.001.04.2.1]RUY42443.1 NAD-dependent epimerase/dehydratase family protein [Mesorhizobium sp. M7A.F.Ca.US.001.04.1.1]RVA07716.1 NAD-dependent epimerase/dehydratase family protein [Mesorhizobium sp. M7A.F.Ca.US.001.02.1.1]RVA15307.1 NAD-dependent epimerase/dehydratase family protein [Mesorhizobium sp. M7A.F.Ca.U